MLITANTAPQIGAYALVVLGAGISAAMGVYGLTDPVLVSAAVAGSVSSVLFNIVSGTSQRAASMARQVLRQIVIFVIGAPFGLFMGASMASVTPLDRVAATYIGGLLGYVLIAGLLSEDARKSLSDWILNVIQRRSGGGGRGGADNGGSA